MPYPSTQFQAHLRSIRACDEARKWAGTRTSIEAWEQCERADWLLWWAANTAANTHQQVVRTACACARRALKFVPAGEDCPRLAIEAAERWSEDPSEENRIAARHAAAYAAYAADASYAAASYAASYAASSADAAASAADAAASAAVSAAYAAYAVAPEHREMCTLVREMLQQPWKESE